VALWTSILSRQKMFVLRFILLIGIFGSIIGLSEASDLEHIGEDCWGDCNAEQGQCNWCGYDGWCCRKDWTGNGCDGTFGGENQHVCVQKPCGGSQQQCTPFHECDEVVELDHIHRSWKTSRSEQRDAGYALDALKCGGDSDDTYCCATGGDGFGSNLTNPNDFLAGYKISGGEVLREFTAEDFAECFAECQISEACGAWGYDSDTNRCTLSSLDSCCADSQFPVRADSMLSGSTCSERSLDDCACDPTVHCSYYKITPQNYNPTAVITTIKQAYRSRLQCVWKYQKFGRRRRSWRCVPPS